LTPEDDERALLAWLKAYAFGDPALPAIHLGYGMSDRYAAASAMLAARLPAGQVVTIDGGHDWGTWLKLWQLMLDQGLFSAAGTQAGAGASGDIARADR
jgi:hypothetical protein